MKAPRLQQVLETIDTIPSLPAVVMALLEGMDSNEVDLDMIRRKLEQDQALTARTLKLANSSFYGMQRQIRTVGEAMAVLGMRNLRSVIMTAALIGSMSQGKEGAIDQTPFWRHSIGTALCARAIAARTGLNLDYSYTIGLLHDIGRLVLATRFPDAMRAVTAYRLANDCFAVDAETAVLGFEHAQVGAALALHWDFPQQMQMAVALHHQPEHPEIDNLGLLAHVADAIAHAMDFDADTNNLVPLVRPATWHHLDIDARKLRLVLEDADTRFQAACAELE